GSLALRPVAFSGDTLAPSTPVWSPNGGSLAVSAARNIATDAARGTAVYDIYEQPLDSAEQHLLLGSAERKNVLDWHNEFLLYGVTAADMIGASSLVVSRLKGGDQPISVDIAPLSFRQDARFSPDGHWIAYQSELDRASEIFVQPFPGSAADR